MQPDWTSLLVQIPIVAAFIYYANNTQKAFLEALQQRDEEYEKRNTALISALGELTKAINCHDENVAARVAAIQQAAVVGALNRPTRPRKDAN